MAKFTDAIVATLKTYFEAGDQPTEAQFAAWIDDIQEGIEEHNHDGTGDGDGMQLDWDDIWSDAVHDHSAAGEGGQLDWDVVWSDAVHDHSAAGEGGATLGFTAMTGAGVDVPDDWYIGIGAALERIVFDNAGDVCVMGAFLGVETLTPHLIIASDESANGPIFNIRGNLARVAIQGDVGARLEMVDLGGGADDKWMQWYVDTGVATFRSITDAGVVRTANILVMDMGTGGVQIGVLAGANQPVGADATGLLYVPHVPSDLKLKSNVKPLTGALEVVCSLRPVTFNWNKEALADVGLDFGDSPRQVGLISQEVVEVIPDARSDGQKFESYDKGMIMPYVVKAIQELDERLTAGGL